MLGWVIFVGLDSSRSRTQLWWLDPGELDICNQPRGTPAGDRFMPNCPRSFKARLSTEAVVFGDPLILVMPVLGLLIAVDQLEDSTKQSFIHTGGNIRVISSFEGELLCYQCTESHRRTGKILVDLRT